MKNNSKDLENEIFRKYGVTITDMAERGIRALGILGGIRRPDQEPSKEHSHVDASDGSPR